MVVNFGGHVGADPALGIGPLVGALASSENRQHALLGVPVTGLLWSLGTLLARREQVDALGISPLEALFYISLGGIAQTLLFSVGFTGVLWAMTRAFGGQVVLLRMITLVSGASIALWVGALAAAFWINGAGGQATIAAAVTLLSLALFLKALAKGIAGDLDWSVARASGAVVVTTIFLVSFAFLTL
jgi:hypothetical protein